MRFTLRQLEVFLAVARSESVSRAATELGMSQSAVSGALSDLEQQFEIQLFDRIGKRLRLSALGRSLRPPGEALEERARELEQALSSRSAAGPLRIGATLTIGNYVAMPLVARFLREHPGARVKLEIGNTAEITRRVQNFEIDVGLVEGELRESELRVTPWCDDELVVFCAPAHPFASKESLDDRDLLAASWIVREPGSGTRQAFEHAMRGVLSELEIRLELPHTEAIKSAVEAGMGVGCVSRIAVAEAFRHGSLIPCRVPHRDFRRQFFFALHEEKYLSAPIQSWLELCSRWPAEAPKDERPNAS
jgi:DNA-binding transcriptional LysR family regulator